MRAPLADIRQRRRWKFPTPAHSADRQKHRLSPDIPESYACPTIVHLSGADKMSSDVF